MDVQTIVYVVPDGMKRADTYPKFCPTCGEPRYVQVVKAKPVLIFVNEFGPTEIVNNIKPLVEDVPYCVRCGFRWAALTAPADITVNNLISNLSQNELLGVARKFNKVLANLVTDIAEQLGKSKSHVNRVFNGERKGADVEEVLAKEVLRRFQAVQQEEAIAQAGPQIPQIGPHAV